MPKTEGSSQVASSVVRTALLTAVIEGSKVVERVEIKRIDMPPRLASGLHLHPCPVVGIVTKGSGDAFFEPANVRVPHFDAQEEGASFVAYYLLAANESELIRMLE